MKTTYIQFEAPKNENKISKDGLVKSVLKKVFLGILTKVIPKANPDFEDKIEEVKYWLVECNSETGIPEREIGLDKEGREILKMHFKDNYGYWIDNNLLLNDFKKHFVVSEISKEKFEQSWELFGKISDFEIEISDYKIQTTGADGGHVYINTEINYNGKQRELYIYFRNKSDEQKLKAGNKIKLRGKILDQGINQSLSLMESQLIE